MSWKKAHLEHLELTLLKKFFQHDLLKSLKATKIEERVLSAI